MQRLQRVTANYAMVSPRLQINEHDWLTYSWELVGRGAASSLGSIIGDEPTPTSAAVGSSAATIAFSASHQHVNSHWDKTTHIDESVLLSSACLSYTLVMKRFIQVIEPSVVTGVSVKQVVVTCSNCTQQASSKSSQTTKDLYMGQWFWTDHIGTQF